jgi:FtsP/CotA-like multicopper oxidase with cupredoxin domain
MENYVGSGKIFKKKAKERLRRMLSEGGTKKMAKQKSMIWVGFFMAALALGGGGLRGGAESQEKVPLKLRQTTPQDREAAAVRAAVRRQSQQGRLAIQAVVPAALGTPDYFGVTPNYANSPIIKKFVDGLPGLGPSNANNLGQFIPIAVADTTTYPGSDYYQIGLVNYTQKMHSELPPTQLRGYKDLSFSADGKAHYLGPLIIAQRDRPVRIMFTNLLPVSGTPGSNLFLPVDTSIMGAGMGPLDDGGAPCDPMTATCANYPQNRAVIHLHGGLTPWISDGTPHQWITPAGDTSPFKKGVSYQNVPDMPDPGDGSATYYYPNQQSSRLMFYHDHAYGMTRLNVYAGEAAGYLLTDTVEEALIKSKVLPDLGGVYHYGIPLIIQDKTFVPNPVTLAAQDPTWDTANWGGMGSLWFPHVYMPNQNPADEAGANAMGRWDYGPWFWPPVTSIKHPPLPNPVPGGPDIPGTPNPSLVPEAFLDTPVVNGTAYPYLKVKRQAYRFRILNACNDRFLNLQLYYADPTASKEVKMVAARKHAGYPPDWPTDGRDGGVPDPKRRGPSMIQIGTEGGFLPAPVVLPNTPIGYVYNRRDITVLNVSTHTLLLGPAERADVIIDFSKAPVGSKIILYNDAPAPIPGFDPRNDYYKGDPDLTSTGGAPSTKNGLGPNTRTIMQFRVSGAQSAHFNLKALNAALPAAFAASQPVPVVTEAAYGPVYGASFPNTYARIESNSLTFTPIGAASPTTVQLTPKAIHELFELNYGRMNSLLGTELPFTSFFNQTTIPLAFIDPATEIINNDEVQIWKIVHNGVDTHAIHFHLFNVQLVNRIGWDGAVKPPDPNELGWKETVRMNPLEVAVVALRPVVPRLPFLVPDSVRLFDPTNVQGSTGQFTGIDPYTNNPISVTNDMTNFGWEYVWHCHLLGHEENDMMRPVTIENVTGYLTPVTAPSDLAAGFGAGQVDLSWMDNSNNETGFRIERATGAGAFVEIGTVGANVTIFQDTSVQSATTYSYRVIAFDGTGDSLPSNTVTIRTVVP